MTNAIRTSDFINSIGVNTHLRYTDSTYANIPNVIADLKYLGIDNIRDNAMNTGFNIQIMTGLNMVANAGIKMDLFDQGDLPDTMTALDKFAQAHPGTIRSIEGPNEVNNFPVSYNGLTGTAGAIAFQNALYASVKSDPKLAGVPVYNFTDNIAASGSSDALNIHPYASNGAQPMSAIQSNISQLAPNHASGLVITEAGYSTANTTNGVDQITQAKETLNLLMDSIKSGASVTYLYQLMDGYSDPSGTNLEDHFGLFDASNNPKLAATAIHNLTAILSDPGSTSSSFKTGSLNYTIKGMKADGNSLLMEKSNGAFDLVVWEEPQIWNSTTKTDVAAKTDKITINLGAKYADVKVFDPLAGTTATEEFTNVSKITLNATDHPLIIEVEPETTKQAKKAANTSVATTLTPQLGTSSSSLLALPTR
ncbi:MAG TPA: hypothetical protein VHC39_11950 [Rhizomicrobium sp.]|nr:hypothetical protein [Rhizomicrobium sp.]